MNLLFNTDIFQRRLAETITWCIERIVRSFTESNLQAWRSHWDSEVDEVMIPRDLETMFRSPELKPANLFEYELYSHLWNDWRNAGAKLAQRQVIQARIVTDREKTVDMLAETRVRSLQKEKKYPEKFGFDLIGGRLLGYAPDHTLSEGASENETDGYLDSNDMPPWDSWICYCSNTERDYLISWVPASLIPIISDGIAVNSSDCIFWLDEQAEQRQ